MIGDAVHLRARKGGPICGGRGPAVQIAAIEWFARQRVRRCARCWQLALDWLAKYRGRP